MKLYPDGRYFAIGGSRSFVFDNFSDALGAEYEMRKALFEGKPAPQYATESEPPTGARARIYDESVSPERVLKDTIAMLKATVSSDTLDANAVFGSAIKNGSLGFLTVWGKLPAGAADTEFLVSGEQPLSAIERIIGAEEPPMGLIALIDAYIDKIPAPDGVLRYKMYMLKTNAYTATDFAGAWCELLRRATANVFSSAKFWDDFGMQQTIEFEYIIDRYIEALGLALKRGYKAPNDACGKLKLDCCDGKDDTAKRLLKYIDILSRLKSALLRGCSPCDAKELYDMGYEWPDIEMFLYKETPCYTR